MDAVESVLPKGDYMVSSEEMDLMREEAFRRYEAEQAELNRAAAQAAQSDPMGMAYGGMVDPRMRQPVGMAEGGMMADEGIGAMMAQDGMATPEDAMVGTLDAAAQGIGALDASQDYEQAINSVRGDQMPIEEIGRAHV